MSNTYTEEELFHIGIQAQKEIEAVFNSYDLSNAESALILLAMLEAKHQRLLEQNPNLID